MSRSVPGALREHPGSVPREGARPTGPIGIPYKSRKGSSVNRNLQRKTQMFQKTTNLTTILAILGVPTTLFGGSSGRGTRQRAPEGRLGGCQVWRDLYDLCKIQNTYTFFCDFLKIIIPYDSAHIWAPNWGARGRPNLTSPSGLSTKTKKTIFVLEMFEKTEFHMTARILGAKIRVPRGRPDPTGPIGIADFFNFSIF